MRINSFTTLTLTLRLRHEDKIWNKRLLEKIHYLIPRQFWWEMSAIQPSSFNIIIYNFSASFHFSLHRSQTIEHVFHKRVHHRYFWNCETITSAKMWQLPLAHRAWYRAFQFPFSQDKRLRIKNESMAIRPMFDQKSHSHLLWAGSEKSSNHLPHKCTGWEQSPCRRTIFRWLERISS